MLSARDLAAVSLGSDQDATSAALARSRSAEGIQLRSSDVAGGMEATCARTSSKVTSPDSKPSRTGDSVSRCPTSRRHHESCSELPSNTPYAVPYFAFILVTTAPKSLVTSSKSATTNASRQAANDSW